jgi:hypothetical protein
MRDPCAPFLGLNFYFADNEETDAVLRLVAALVGLGASFTGEGYAHLGSGIQDTPFADITDPLLERVAVTGLPDVKRHIVDRDTRLVQVRMVHATGIAEKDVSEIVTYLSIPSKVVYIDQHPVSIWTDGDAFSGPRTFSREQASLARKIGRQAYRRFLALVERLQPAYGAITVEWELECPSALRQDSRSYAFSDFYVSQRFVGMAGIDRLKTLFANAYVEPVGDGVYISSYQYFNPDGMQLDNRLAYAKSAGVVEMIAAGGSTPS